MRDHIFKIAKLLNGKYGYLIHFLSDKAFKGPVVKRILHYKITSIGLTSAIVGVSF